MAPTREARWNTVSTPLQASRQADRSSRSAWTNSMRSSQGRGVSSRPRPRLSAPPPVPPPLGDGEATAVLAFRLARIPDPPALEAGDFPQGLHQLADGGLLSAGKVHRLRPVVALGGGPHPPGSGARDGGGPGGGPA